MPKSQAFQVFDRAAVEAGYMCLAEYIRKWGEAQPPTLKQERLRSDPH